ncbi:MAG: TRAP transporter substrate-binding protein DctP [Clostridiales Family XIII bacterium]|jgi:TRAP-type C4-dicarboxylate transport system substrate-binding protein|nr:TRAP transporter substrate-binding protein DctP [Clostridiales Family XIII bacterium]
MMKKKYRILAVALCLAMALAFALSGCGSKDEEPEPSGDANPPASEEPKEVIKISYASNDAPGSDRYDLLEQKFADLMKEKSGGRIEVEIYPSGSLSSPGKTLDNLKNGSVDSGIDSFTRYSGQYPYYELLTAPGLNYSNAEAFTKVIYEYIQEFPDATIGDYKIIALYDTGNFGLVSTKPISKYSDIKGLQIRNTPQFIPLFNKLGASSVDVASGDMYEALRLNTITAANTNDHAIPAFNLGEVCDSFTRLPFEHADFGIFMSLDRYNSFDDELKAAVDEVCVEMQKVCADYLAQTTANAKENTLAVNPDFQFIELSNEEVAKFVEAAGPTLDEMAKKLDGNGLKGSEALAWLRDHQSK